jgi:hypothetical protein
LKFLSLLFQILQMKQCFIPATFQRVGYKPIGWIYFLITPFGKSNFVFSALESHLPLAQNGLIAYFEFLQSGECEFEFGWLTRGCCAFSPSATPACANGRCDSSALNLGWAEIRHPWAR